jgi:lipopolysaccharide O-acetyltransferase
MLLRRPFYVRSCGKLIVGRGFSAGPGLILDVLSKNATIKIGTNVKINHRAHIGAIDCVEIGNDVLFASNVFISDHSHGCYKGEIQDSPITPPNHRPLVSAPVKIGNRVWLGENVCVLPGVTVGDGCIVGAGSVITTSIPENSIVAGAPARVIKVWNNDMQRWVKI